RDLNPHVRRTLTPEASASTNSATFATPLHDLHRVTTGANSRDFLNNVNDYFRSGAGFAAKIVILTL
ncbi:hypothetical protein, partial [Candidatus Symbiopectobacterium sp. NZEC135]|uniref:hypothetical protein n=1 Tax=Candidatus Symbiopectobacterium sp. NZEC135 TaxID=2820471 RepID=UPI002226C74E